MSDDDLTHYMKSVSRLRDENEQLRALLRQVRSELWLAVTSRYYETETGSAANKAVELIDAAGVL